MKKVFVAIVILVAANALKAQMNFGVNAGGLFTNLKTSFDGNNTKGEKSKIGFKVGIFANIPLTSGFSIAPELNFVAKGNKISYTEQQIILGVTTKQSTEGKVNLSYIELPFNFIYTPSGKEPTGIFLGAGPSISFGVGGKSQGDFATSTTIGNLTTTSNSSYSSEVKFDGKKKNELADQDKRLHLKALEMGANVFVGYHFTSNIHARIMYNIGFSNLDPDDKATAKNSYFGLSFGYKL